MQDTTLFSIRRIQAQDTELLVDYFMSFSEETRHFFIPHDLDRTYAEKLTQKDLTNPETHRFVMVTRQNNEEHITGYFYFWDWHKKVPWFGIGVRDGYKGKGLGSQMMAFAIREAQNHHKGGILLTTRKDNERAQKLYKKAGFEIIGENPQGEYLLLLNFSDQ